MSPCPHVPPWHHLLPKISSNQLAHLFKPIRIRVRDHLSEWHSASKPSKKTEVTNTAFRVDERSSDGIGEQLEKRSMRFQRLKVRRGFVIFARLEHIDRSKRPRLRFKTIGAGLKIKAQLVLPGGLVRRGVRTAVEHFHRLRPESDHWVPRRCHEFIVIRQKAQHLLSKHRVSQLSEFCGGGGFARFG